LARDLIVGEKVDLLIGSTSVASSIAISDVAAQLKTLQIALASMGASG
jgi:branched-chain amino acid transport system substrate-binding protein